MSQRLCEVATAAPVSLTGKGLREVDEPAQVPRSGRMQLSVSRAASPGLGKDTDLELGSSSRKDHHFIGPVPGI